MAGDIQFTTAGGKWSYNNSVDELMETLWRGRPGITWTNEPTEIRVNPALKDAFEMGNWTEAWTEPDGKVTLTGRYFVLWMQDEPGVWLMHGAIFTPLECTDESSYCTSG